MSAPAAPTRHAWLEEDERFAGLLLVLTVFLAAVYALFNGAFHFDDFHNLVENESVRSLANLPRFFTDPSTWSAEPGNTMYRPLQMASYAIDHALWRYRPSGWILTNTLLHAAVVLCVWRLALRIGLSAFAAFLAGLVFALHPANSEVVNYVSSRSESLAALLMLGALHAHLTARRAAGAAAAAAWCAASCALFALSLLAKETTALYFAGVAWMEFVLAAREPLATRCARALRYAALYGVVFAAVMLLRRLMLHQATAPVPLLATPEGADPRAGGTISILDNLLKTQTRVVVIYLQVLFRPVQLNIDYDVARSAVWTASSAAALAIHAAVAAWALAALRRGQRLFPLCVGWFWLFLAPSIAYPLNVVMNEHRLYLPGIAVALLAGASLARVADLLGARWGAARGAVIAAAPLVLYLPLDIQRSVEWRSDEALWTAAVARAPGSARAHMHLGAAFHAQHGQLPPGSGRDLLEKAVGEYLLSAQLFPGSYDTQLNLGSAYLDLGRIDDDREQFAAALDAFRAAGRIAGESAVRPRYFQAVALAELGEYDEAVAIMRELQAGDDTVTTMYDDFVARALRRKGDKAEAAAAMEKVIAIEEPLGRVDGLLALAWWKFEDDDVPGAKALLDRALKISNDHVKANQPASYLPYLYAARMLHLLGIGGREADGFLDLARRVGWGAAPDELQWARGGATPGAIRRGTRSVAPYGRPR